MLRKNIFTTLKRSSSSTLSNLLSNSNTSTSVELKGWVKAMRKMKDLIFFDISDGSCNEKLQVVLPKEMKPEKLSIGSSVAVSGKLSNNSGQLELSAEQIKIYQQCSLDEGYPFRPKHTYPNEVIRQHLHFRPKLDNFSSIFRIRSTATKIINDFFHKEGFIHVHCPIITSNDCEGAGEVFSVIPSNKQLLKTMAKADSDMESAYFDVKSFLTVSAQLHLEAFALGLSKVYSFNPTFRAENSKSRLHLSEFYMIEAESAFVSNLEDVMNFVEILIKSVTDDLISSSKDLQKRKDVDFSWINKKFIVLRYSEMLDKLEKMGENIAEDGITKEQELMLVDHYDKVPVFIIDWPSKLKPFYAKSIDQDKVAAFDLLVPNVGELVGGSLREDNYDVLKNKLGHNHSDLSWYLDIRKFGGAPCGGFGIGFERYLQWILNISNIKDTIPFPRWPHNCKL